MRFLNQILQVSLVFLAAACGTVEQQPGPLFAIEKEQGALFLSRVLVSGAVETILEEETSRTDGRERSSNDDFSFINEGVLQFGFRSQSEYACVEREEEIVAPVNAGELNPIEQEEILAHISAKERNDPLNVEEDIAKPGRASESEVLQTDEKIEDLSSESETMEHRVDESVANPSKKAVMKRGSQERTTERMESEEGEIMTGSVEEDLDLLGKYQKEDITLEKKESTEGLKTESAEDVRQMSTDAVQGQLTEEKKTAQKATEEEKEFLESAADEPERQKTKEEKTRQTRDEEEPERLESDEKKVSLEKNEEALEQQEKEEEKQPVGMEQGETASINVSEAPSIEQEVEEKAEAITRDTEEVEIDSLEELEDQDSEMKVVTGGSEKRIDAQEASADRVKMEKDSNEEKPSRAESVAGQNQTDSVEKQVVSGGITPLHTDSGADTFRQYGTEFLTHLNVEYWEVRNESLYKLIKHDRNLKWFYKVSNEQYKKRLKSDEALIKEDEVVKLIKTGPASIKAGEPIEYGFILENLSGTNGIQSTDIHNIVLLDMLEQGLFYDGEYEGKIISKEGTFTFSNEDSSDPNGMLEFTTSAEWSKGKIAWFIPGVLRPGDRLEFTFRAVFFREKGLVKRATPLMSKPVGGERLAVLKPEETAVRVIERNPEANWLRVSVRSKNEAIKGTLVGYIAYDHYDADVIDDADRERIFWESNYASQIREEAAAQR